MVPSLFEIKLELVPGSPWQPDNADTWSSIYYISLANSILLTFRSTTGSLKDEIKITGQIFWSSSSISSAETYLKSLDPAADDDDVCVQRQYYPATESCCSTPPCWINNRDDQGGQRLPIVVPGRHKRKCWGSRLHGLSFSSVLRELTEMEQLQKRLTSLPQGINEHRPVRHNEK